VQPLQSLTRFQAKLRAQDAATIGEGGQGISLPPASVQRQHQLPAQPFPERIFTHQARQFGRRRSGLTQHQHDLGPLLDRGQPHLAEPDTLDLGPGTGSSRQRIDLPQTQRCVERPHRCT
jgi:hypothetical protein